MRSYVLGAFSLVLLAGCAAGDEDAESSEDMLVSSAARPFDVAQVAATKTFRAPSGRTEVCVIPKHLSEDGFTKKDAKKEAKLCKVDLDAAPGADVLAAGSRAASMPATTAPRPTRRRSSATTRRRASSETSPR